MRNAKIKSTGPSKKKKKSLRVCNDFSFSQDILFVFLLKTEQHLWNIKSGICIIFIDLQVFIS